MCQAMLGVSTYQIIQTIVLTLVVIGLTGPEIFKFCKGRYEQQNQNTDAN